MHNDGSEELKSQFSEWNDDIQCTEWDILPQGDDDQQDEIERQKSQMKAIQSLVSRTFVTHVRKQRVALTKESFEV